VSINKPEKIMTLNYKNIQTWLSSILNAFTAILVILAVSVSYIFLLKAIHIDFLSKCLMSTSKSLGISGDCINRSFKTGLYFFVVSVAWLVVFGYLNHWKNKHKGWLLFQYFSKYFSAIASIPFFLFLAFPAIIFFAYIVLFFSVGIIVICVWFVYSIIGIIFSLF
jgi:hypothetical protein